MARRVLATIARHMARDFANALVAELTQSNIVGSRQQAGDQLLLDCGVLAVADVDPTPAGWMSREHTHAEELAFDTFGVSSQTEEVLATFIKRRRHKTYIFSAM